MTDDQGRGLAGARVAVAGTPLRTVTAADGSYALVVPEERVAPGDSVRVRVDLLGRVAQSRLVAPDDEPRRVDFALAPAAVALDAIVATGAGAPPEAVAWREVDAAEAERRLGRRPVAVPQLPLLGVDVGRVEGRAAVRVRQQMEDGSVLSLVQSRAPRERPRQAEALARAVQQRGGWRIVLKEEGLLVEASAPVRADSLRSIPGREMRP